MASILSTFSGPNMDPWDPNSIYYEDRAEKIVGGQLDAMEATSSFQSQMIRDKIEDRRTARKTAKIKNAVANATNITNLIENIVEVQTAFNDAPDKTPQKKAYEIQYNSLKSVYKEATGQEWA